MEELSWWIRCRFRNRNKVWARCDDRGRLIDENGRVDFSYKIGDERTYTALLNNLTQVDGAEATKWEGEKGKKEKVNGKAKSGQERPKKDVSKDAAKTLSTPRKTSDKTIGKWELGKGQKEDVVTIYTDGACTGNPGPAGSGALLMYQGKEKEASRYLGVATNNIAELDAIMLSLEILKRSDLPVHIYTDSTYVIGVLQKGWKTKANLDQIEEIKLMMQNFPGLRLKKVRGHAGIEPNERVDQLAREAVVRRKGVIQDNEE